MISASFDLAAGLLILGAEAFALFLMILGAIDLWGHIQGERTRAN